MVLPVLRLKGILLIRINYMPYVSAKKVTIYPKKDKKVVKKVVIPETIKAYVQRSIARQAEDKEFRFYTNNLAIRNAVSLATISSSIFPVSPYAGFLQIDQGVGQGQRVGNKIRLTHLRLKGTMYPAPYAEFTNPFTVPLEIVLWFFYNRDTPSVVPASGSDFLALGSASVGLSGLLTDVWAPINTDQYVLKKKVHYKLGFAISQGDAGVSSSQYFANNDFKLNQNFDIDLLPHVVKNVVFDDNISIPTTRGLFCMAEAIYAHGTAMASDTIISARMSISLECKYEDL